MIANMTCKDLCPLEFSPMFQSMIPHLFRMMPLALLTNLNCALASLTPYEWSVKNQTGSLVLEIEDAGLRDLTLFVAISRADHSGSVIVPFGKDRRDPPCFCHSKPVPFWNRRLTATS